MNPNAKQQRRLSAHSMVQVALCTAMLAVLAQIQIPLPGLVPFSLAILGVALVSVLLTPGQALAAVGAYLALGLVGLPVFAGFRGGAAVLAGPTGGYLVGYLVLAWAFSWARHRFTRPAFQFAGGIVGLVGCYTIGTLWYMLVLHQKLWAALVACVLPFALFDFIKLGLALWIGSLVQARRKDGPTHG